MLLLTKALKAKLPALYANENRKADETPIIVKFFTPWTSWTWYATEYDPETGRFFGLVRGHDTELGYWTLGELESLRGPFGLKVERDMHFKGKTIQDAQDRHI